jgi:pilus assembly protein Flp/PilA
MYAFIRALGSDESGATAVEYGIMVALIAVVIIVAVALVGTNLDALYRDEVLGKALENRP